MSTQKQIFIDPSQSKSNTAQQIKQSCGSPIEVSEAALNKDFRSGKKTLAITPKKGQAFDTCATYSNEYVCCNVKVLKSIKNCPFDCSYCFLQDYLNNSTMQVVGDTDALIKEIQSACEQQPWRLFRIGTWELGDSLALEAETGQAKALIKAVAKMPQVFLELKTKSDQVDSILDLDHQERSVISWSMNPPRIIREQEHRTSDYESRLLAMKKAVDAGYLIGLHFDPMIYYDEWEQDYPELIANIFETIPSNRVAWISLGSLRFKPDMKQQIMANFPKQQITHAEMVTGNDGKMRYVKPLRLDMYEKVISAIKAACNTDTISPIQVPSPNTPLFYFCMERWDVWEHLLGESPRSVGHLDHLFAQHLQHRFPHLVNNVASIEQYETSQDTPIRT